MDSASISTRTLEISGMSGDECVQKVSAALKEVQDITTQFVKVGSATIAADQAGCDAAYAAIEKAGYQVSERGKAMDQKTEKANSQIGATPQQSGAPAANSAPASPTASQTASRTQTPMGLPGGSEVSV